MATEDPTKGKLGLATLLRRRTYILTALADGLRWLCASKRRRVAVVQSEGIIEFALYFLAH